MKRRKFLKYSLSAASAHLLLGGQVLGVISDNLFLKALTANNKSRKLVLIQLNGGNDGLNTFTPYEYYDKLKKARSNIIIPENKLIHLTDALGLHPAMNRFKLMYDEEEALIIQNVGYPNPNLSHFRSKDIMTSGSSSDTVLNSGWIGRYLQELYPDFPDNYPNENAPHPIAITVGATSSATCQGDASNLSIVLQNLNVSYQQTGGVENNFPDSPYGHELQFVTEAMQATEAYLDTVQEAASKAENLSPLYPQTGKNKLADQLAMVARLIAGGLNTQIYVVSLGGFDTHANQVASETETDQGKHADLLKELADAIYAFQDDLKLMAKSDEVIGFVFSEFGRRIASNDSLGTDHGEAYPAILFGKPINPTVMGHIPTITDDVDQKQNVQMEFDFRSIYASIFHEWFEADDTTINTILYDDFDVLPILKTSDQSGFFNKVNIRATVFPVPTTDFLNMKIYNKDPELEIVLFNELGQKTKILMDGTVSGTFQNLQFSVTDVPPGHYVVRIRSKKDFITKRVIIKD